MDPTSGEPLDLLRTIGSGPSGQRNHWSYWYIGPVGSGIDPLYRLLPSVNRTEATCPTIGAGAERFDGEVDLVLVELLRPPAAGRFAPHLDPLPCGWDRVEWRADRRVRARLDRVQEQASHVDDLAVRAAQALRQCVPDHQLDRLVVRHDLGRRAPA